MPILRRVIFSGNLVLLLVGFLIWGSCAYYNTLFNAKNSYKEGLKALQEKTDSEKISPNAKKQFETTIEKCWKLIEIYGENSKYADDALLYIVRSEFHLAKYAQAGLHVDQLIKKYPRSALLPEAYLWKAKILLKEDSVDEANQYFLQVINNSKDAELRSQANLELGLYAFENKNYEQAVVYFNKALKEKLEDQYKAELLFHLGEAYFIQKNYKEAIKHFKKVEKFSPAIDIEYKAKMQLAVAYRNIGKHNDAYTLLKKMLTAPRFKRYESSINSAIARNYHEQGLLEEAVDLYKNIVRERKTDEGTARAALDLARIYENVYHNIDSAVVYYGKVEQLYNRFDSLEAARNKKVFLSEFKKIRDQIKRDEKLVNRLTYEPEFRDSLYNAQYEDSLRKAGGFIEEENLSESDSLPSPFDRPFLTLQDSLAKAKQDSLDSLAAVTKDSLDEKKVDEFQSFRNQQASQEPQKIPEELQQASQISVKENKRVLETRKLPQIEFDLMNNKYQLAEFYLLKVENYDSAAYHYNQFLQAYQDSILTPKAIYSLIYIYRTPKHKKPQEADSLERIITNQYPESPFAKEIMKNKGVLPIREQSPVQEMEEMFLEAEEQYFSGNYQQAIDTYRKVAADTTLEISAKAQYAIAWIYEYDLALPDSALKAYQKIIDRYPTASAYVSIARKKTTPPREESPSTAEEGSQELVSAGDSARVVDDRQTKIDIETPASVSGDILKQKIRWRNRRNRSGIE